MVITTKKERRIKSPFYFLSFAENQRLLYPVIGKSLAELPQAWTIGVEPLDGKTQNA